MYAVRLNFLKEAKIINVYKNLFCISSSFIEINSYW